MPPSSEWVDRVSSEVKSKYEWVEPEKTVIEELSKYENILEIGSGMGRYTKLIPRVVGLEYSRFFVNYCKRHVKAVFLRADGFNIPIEDNVFDCVFSSGVIEHFDNPADMIKEHVRVCKVGGCVIITVPAKDSPTYIRFTMQQNLLAHDNEKDWRWYGRRIGDDEMYKLLKEAELGSIKLFHLGHVLGASIKNILGYLQQFLLLKGSPTMLVKGLSLEMFGLCIGTRMFRFITRDFILQNYMHSKGYYLFQGYQIVFRFQK